MTASGSGRSPERLERALFTGAMLLQSLALLAALGVFAYLGSFSRYRADDYCDTASVRAAGLGAVIERYSLGQWRAADRYSNMLFVWFSESLGPRNLPFILAAMILLWVAALVWMAHELRRLASIQWPAWLDFFLPALLAFLAILQAPNRFQTLYWRSGMATHFAPLVLMCLLAAFVLRQVRTSKSASLPLDRRAGLPGGLPDRRLLRAPRRGHDCRRRPGPTYRRPVCARAPQALYPGPAGLADGGRSCSLPGHVLLAGPSRAGRFPGGPAGPGCGYAALYL
jgi:hypothetical protein